MCVCIEREMQQQSGARTRVLTRPPIPEHTRCAEAHIDDGVPPNLVEGSRSTDNRENHTAIGSCSPSHAARSRYNYLPIPIGDEEQAQPAFRKSPDWLHFWISLPPPISVPHNFAAHPTDPHHTNNCPVVTITSTSDGQWISPSLSPRASPLGVATDPPGGDDAGIGALRAVGQTLPETRLFG